LTKAIYNALNRLRGENWRFIPSFLNDLFPSLISYHATLELNKTTSNQLYWNDFIDKKQTTWQSNNALRICSSTGRCPRIKPLHKPAFWSDKQM